MSAPGWPAPELRERLAAPRPSLTELLEVIGEVETTVPAARTWSVGVSANLTVAAAEAYFKRQAYLAGLGCRFVAGGYDTHLDNVRDFLAQGVDHLVLIPFFDNLVPALETRLGELDAEAIAALLARVRAELALVLAAARPFKAVFLVRFHRFTAPPAMGPDPVADALAAFDALLGELAQAHPNVVLLAGGDLVTGLGRAQAFNPRFYYAYKAPYAGAFWDELARRCLLATRADGSHYYKALVLDADDTLWGGVLGETTADGIALDPHAYPGNVYWTVQHELLALQRAGVLLCLCSRNDAAEVDAVLASHPHRVLHAAHFVLRKVDWRDKVDRLVEIAEELGLGLDSLVFLDDSPFECEAVRSRLPEVRVFQVPEHVFDYPALLQEIKALFPQAGARAAAPDKTAQYRDRARARGEQARFPRHEDYLRSLGIRVTLRRDDQAQAARVAELTQKSNQFNLTTPRLTNAEVLALMADPRRTVYTLGVRDRFGDAGLTGVLVVRFEGAIAHLETFLLSCRVLGRGIEHACWPRVFADARARGCEAVAAAYVPTARNGQVAGFWETLGLTEVARDAGGTRYQARLDALPPGQPPPLEVDDGP